MLASFEQAFKDNTLLWGYRFLSRDQKHRKVLKFSKTFNLLIVWDRAI